jgi:hypothetical protein
MTDGCRPAFWARAINHDLWEEHEPSELVGGFFPEPEQYARLTLVEALGEPSPDRDVRRILIREAVAAILNAAHESLGYPYSRYQVGLQARPPIVPTVAELLRAGSSDQMVVFTQELAEANRLGCPLG